MNWLVGELAGWWKSELMKWQVEWKDKAGWKNGESTKDQVGGMASWWNYILMKSQVDKKIILPQRQVDK